MLKKQLLMLCQQFFWYTLSKFNLAWNTNLSAWVATEPSLHWSKCDFASFRCPLEMRALSWRRKRLVCSIQDTFLPIIGYLLHLEHCGVRANSVFGAGDPRSFCRLRDICRDKMRWKFLKGVCVPVCLCLCVPVCVHICACKCGCSEVCRVCTTDCTSL